MDAERYGCEFNWKHDKGLPEKAPAKTILTPKNNLLCGVKILENQMLTLRRPLLTPSSYWVTLRPATPSYLVFAKQMKNVPAVCRATMPPVEEAKPSAPAECRQLLLCCLHTSGQPISRLTFVMVLTRMTGSSF